MKVFYIILFSGLLGMGSIIFFVIVPIVNCFDEEETLNNQITQIAKVGYKIVQDHFEENNSKIGTIEKLAYTNQSLALLGSDSWVNQYNSKWEYEFIIHQCLETMQITEEINQDGTGAFYTNF